MNEPLDTLTRVGAILIALLPGAVWVAWWLGAVNWKKLWPVLAGGAWAPAVLLLLLAAVVWSRVAPGPLPLLGLGTLPNFVGQLVCVTALAGVALFCGWLQGRLGWRPAEVSVEPPAAESDGHTAHH